MEYVKCVARLPRPRNCILDSTPINSFVNYFLFNEGQEGDEFDEFSLLIYPCKSGLITLRNAGHLTHTKILSVL